MVSVVGNFMAGWLEKKQVFLLGYLEEAGKSITGGFCGLSQNSKQGLYYAYRDTQAPAAEKKVCLLLMEEGPTFYKTCVLDLENKFKIYDTGNIFH